MVNLDSPGQKRSYSIRDPITNSISNLSLYSIVSNAHKKVKVDDGRDGRDSGELTSLEVLDAESINSYFNSSTKQFPNISPHFMSKLKTESIDNFKTDDALHDPTTFTSSCMWSRNNSLDLSRNSLFIPKTCPPYPPISKKSSFTSFVSSKSNYYQPRFTIKQFYRSTMKESDDIDHLQDDHYEQKLLRKKSSKKILTRIKTLFSHDKKPPSQHVYNKRNDNGSDFDNSGLDLLKSTKQKTQLQEYFDEHGIYKEQPKIDNQFLDTIYKQGEDDYKKYQKTKFKRELYASDHFLNFGSNEDLIGSLTFIMDQEKINQDDLIDTDSESSHDTHKDIKMMLQNETPDTTHESIPEDYYSGNKDSNDTIHNNNYNNNNNNVRDNSSETIKNIQHDTIGDLNVKDDDYSSKISHEMFVNKSSEEIKQKSTTGKLSSEPISKQNSHKKKKDHWLIDNLLKRSKSSNSDLPQPEQSNSIPALPKLIAINSNHNEKISIDKINEKKEIIANNYSDELNTKPEPIRAMGKGFRRVKSKKSRNKELPATPNLESSLAHSEELGQPTEIEAVTDSEPEATANHDLDIPTSTTEKALDPPAIIIPEVSEQPKITSTRSPIKQKTSPVRLAPPASLVPQVPSIEDQMVSSGMVERPEVEKQETHVYRNIPIMSRDQKMLNRSNHGENDEHTEERRINNGNLNILPTSHVASLIDESDESSKSKFGSHKSPASGTPASYSSSDNNDKADDSSTYSAAEKSNSDTDMEDYNHRIAPAAGTGNTRYMNQKPCEDILPSDLQYNLLNMKQQFGTPIHFTGKQITSVEHYPQQTHYNPHQQYAHSPSQMNYNGYAYSNQQYKQPGAIPPHQQHFGPSQRQTAPPPPQQQLQQQHQGYGQGFPANYVNRNHQTHHHRPQQSSGRHVGHPPLPQHQPPPHQQQYAHPQQQYQHQQYPSQHYAPQQYQPQQYPPQQFTPQQYPPPPPPPPPQHQQQVGKSPKMNQSLVPQQGEPVTRARSKSIGRSASLKKKQLNGPYPQADNSADRTKSQKESSGDHEPSEVPLVQAIPAIPCIPTIPAVPALPNVTNPVKQQRPIQSNNKKSSPLKNSLNNGIEDLHILKSNLKPVKQNQPRLEAAYQAKPTIVNDMSNYTYSKPSDRNNSIENQIHRQLTNSEPKFDPDNRDSYYNGIIGGYKVDKRASVMTTDSLPDPNIGGGIAN